MTGGTPSDAVEAHYGPAQRAVACVTTAVLAGRAYHPSPVPHVLAFADQKVARIGRRGVFWFGVRQWYQLVRIHQYQERSSWTTPILGYEYTIAHGPDPQAIFTFHWHPTGASRVTRLHLHIGGQNRPVGLDKVHVPTGMVSLIEVLRLAIEELGVEPLRADWQAVLDRAEGEPAEDV